MMDKPATVAIEEFKKQLADILNKSGLPAVVLRYILVDVVNSLDEVAKIQLANDTKAYEAAKESADEQSRS